MSSPSNRADKQRGNDIYPPVEINLFTFSFFNKIIDFMLKIKLSKNLMVIKKYYLI